MSKMQDAISILKGEFRGGDPEDLQRKREEKREEMEETGELEMSVASKDKIPGGLAAGKPDSDFDPHSLAAGIKVEREHTNDVAVAREIAKDHLTEDPQYYQKLKKIEKPQEVKKAEAGMEGGEFRGGDPEELQRKREEKREEMEASGEKELQEEEEALAIEEAGGEAAMAEEQALEAEEEEAKAMPWAAAEVSPVDTLEDYRPRNWNGDPLDTQPNYPPKRIEPAPVRDEKTRHLPWSEVLGFKVPKEGAPWAYLRRFIIAGQGDKISEESAKILKSFDASEEAFFTLYKALNRDITFDPEYRIYKGGYEKGSIVEGHKYIYRWMGKNGKWQYRYTDGVSVDHHGLGETGITGGHSIEAHPEWHGEDVSTGQDPQLKDPEAAFHHARQKALEEGGRHRVWIKNRDKWNPELGEPHPETGKPVGDYESEAYILHLPGAFKGGSKAGQTRKRGALQLYQDPTGGTGDVNEADLKGTPDKSWRNWDQLEEHIRRQHVNTIFDIHDKPFVQWYEQKERVQPGKKMVTRPKGEGAAEGPRPAGSQRGRIRMRYMPDSEFSRDVERKAGKVPIGTFHQRFDSVESLKNWARGEKEDQLKEKGLAKPKKRMPPLEPIPVEGGRVINHRKTINKLEQGEFPREREEVPYMAPAAAGEVPYMPSEKRIGTHKEWRIQWKDGAEQERTMTKLTRELYQLSLAVSSHLIDNVVNKERPLHNVPKLWGKARTRAIQALTDSTLGEVVWSAVHRYDPDRGERFAKFVYPKMLGMQKGRLKEVIAEAESRHPLYTKQKPIESAEHEVYQQHPELYAPDEFTTGDPEDFAREASIHEASSLASDAPLLSADQAVHFISSADDGLKEFRGRIERASAANPALKQAYEGKFALIDAAQSELHDITQGIQTGAKGPEDLLDWHANWSAPEYGMSNVLPNPDKLYNDSYEHLEKKQDESHRGAAANIDTMARLEHKFGSDFVNQDPSRLMWIKTNRPLFNRVREEGLKTVGELIQSIQAYKLSHEGYAGAQAQWETDLAHETSRPDLEKAKKPQQQQEPMEEQAPQPDASYLGRHGEPGAYRFMYDVGGNIVQGTNAPIGHEDHNPNMGEPTIHPEEPTPETHPNLFDEQGRKLHAPIPDDAVDVEDNPNYDPDKATGNHWVKKYKDPQSGLTRHAYLHRDQVLDPKMQRNNAMRYVDSQLPKIRSHYHQRLLSDKQADRAVGLFLALLDQAKLPAEYLQNLEVEDVKIRNNVVTFQLGSATNRSALDEASLQVLKELLEGKEANDKVFQVNTRGLDLITLNRFMHNQFGVLPSGIETYNNTELFSREFQRLIQRKNTEYTVRHLREIRGEAAQNVAKMTGTDPNYVERNVDPIVVEALFLAAAANRHRLGKSKGLCEMCGEPNGHCPHTKEKNKLEKGYRLQGRTEFQGLPISIENKKGSVRKWYDPHEKRDGETKMHYDYGYIRGTMGVDKDHVDVYIGPNPNATTAFVVHQMKAPNFTKFDEDKVMLGWDSEKEAKAAYLKQYDNPGFFGAISAIPMEKFKTKVAETKNKPQMIKAHTWMVASDKPERTAEEELFSQWLHDYPLHEHHVHWNALAQATHQHERTLADANMGGTHLPEMLEPEEEEEPPPPEEEEPPDLEAGEVPSGSMAKAIEVLRAFNQ